MVPKAARRYANAYIQTAIEQNILEKARKDMLFIRRTVEDSVDLRLFLKSPIIKKDDKRAVLVSIFGGKVEKLTSSLLSILSDKGRENLLLSVTKGFTELYNLHEGIIEVSVTTASELADKERNSLKDKLESITGKKVLLTSKINKELIGGLTVQIDDTVIDGSVKHKLSQLKEKFTAAAVK